MSLASVDRRPSRRRGAGRRFLVVGDVLDALTVHTSVAQGGEDPTALVQHRAGGAAGNAAAWLGRLGASVDLVARIGVDDAYRHGDALRRAGVRPHLTWGAGAGTGVSVAVQTTDGVRTTMTEGAAAEHLSARDLPSDVVAAADVVLLTGSALIGGGAPAGAVDSGGAPASPVASDGGGGSPGRPDGGVGRPVATRRGADGRGHTDGSALRALVDAVRRAGARVAVDPSSARRLADIGAEAFLDAVAGVDVLLPDVDELRALTGTDDVDEGLARLTGRFPLVVVTDGPAGAVIGRPGHPPRRVAATPVDVVDRSGAGDAFAAGFLCAWATDPVRIGAAVGEGTRVAARALATIGGRPSA